MSGARQTAQTVRRAGFLWPVMLLVMLLAFVAGPAHAAVNGTIALQGALYAAGGGPAADGDYQVTFSLHGQKTGGSALWSESQTIKVAKGQFWHVLGSVKPIPAGLFAAKNGAWLGVKIGNEAEMPRKRIHAVAYARRAAVAEGLACTGCVSIAALKADGDLNLGNKAIKAGNITAANITANKLTAGDVVAKNVVASTFQGDGSKLTGIKVPAGTCSKPGEVVKGINGDGTLKCVRAMDPAGLPADGLNEISNNLLSNQFVDAIIGGTNLPIKDNNPTGTSDDLTFPDIGIAQKFEVLVDLTNSKIDFITLNLYDPNNKLYVLYDKGSKGTSLKGVWPTANKTVKGDLSVWVGKNPKGKWRLQYIDTGYLDNKIDGYINSWSIKIQTLSNKKVVANGLFQATNGLQFQVAAKHPVTCDGTRVGYAYYNTVGKTLYICNGKEFDLAVKAPLGTENKPAVNCLAILNSGDSKGSGVYWLDPDGAGGSGTQFQVWCDMTTAGGGWVLVMQIQSGHSTKFGYGSSYWTSGNITASKPPTALSSTSAKYAAFNTFKTSKGQLLLRDKTSKNHTVLAIPSMSGKTLLNRFQSLGGKTAYNQNKGATLTLVAGKGSPQELMGFAAPTTMCSQNKNKWRMNMLSSHSGARLGNDVATNKQTTNNPSSWKCYDNQSNLSYSGVGGTLESGRQWQDSYGSEALNRWRSGSGKGQGSQNGVELYVR